MTFATVYAIERTDLGSVYVGETVNTPRRIRAHASSNTKGLFSDVGPRVVALAHVAKADAPWEQLLHMREYLRGGWRVVSDLGHADAKDPRVARSPEWTARRSGQSPFGGRTPCTWNASEGLARVNSRAADDPVFARNVAAHYGDPGQTPVVRFASNGDSVDGTEAYVRRRRTRRRRQLMVVLVVLGFLGSYLAWPQAGPASWLSEHGTPQARHVEQTVVRTADHAAAAVDRWTSDFAREWADVNDSAGPWMAANSTHLGSAAAVGGVMWLALLLTKANRARRRRQDVA